MNDAVVITGAGLVTPLGLTRDQTWRAIQAKHCGIGPLCALEQPEPVFKGGGQAPDLPTDFAPGEPREVRYLRWALKEALDEAGALDKLPYPPHRCGFMLGTTLHGMRAAGDFLRSGSHAPLKGFLAGSTLRSATRGLPFTGPAATTCSACSSSLGSIALAVTLLNSGQLDLVVTGGYDTISEYAYAGFNSLRLVAGGPLRPFARDREGMKLAEGYGIVVLERASGAAARRAPIVATIRGCGESADAHHLTQPHPEGEGAARAIAAALADAQLTPNQIDLVAAHATGTPDNDAGEYAALNRTMDEQLPRIPVVGFKSHLGHTLGGAGACELILSAMALRDQVVPGCANATTDQSDFAGMNLSTETRGATIRATLNTSLGFGGANTCIVLTPAPKTTPQADQAPLRDVFITGIGVVLPGVLSPEQLAVQIDRVNSGGLTKDIGAIAESDYLHLLNARRVRRMSEYVKLTLAATALAFSDASITDIPAFAEQCSVILGSMHGSTSYSTSYYREIVQQGIAAANPMLFAEGVPNAAAAHLSLMLSLKGACQTVIGSRTAGLDALRLASLRIATGQWDRAIIGAAEEYDDVINACYRHCDLYAHGSESTPFGDETGFFTQAGAVTFILESRQSMEQRNARPRGTIVRSASGRAVDGHPVAAIAQVLADLKLPRQIISSANGTWIDRAELAAIQKTERPATLSTIYGHVAEVFSVMPLVAIAAALSTDRLPRLLGKIDSPLLSASAGEPLDSTFAALCTDYTGVVSGVTLSPITR